MSKPTHATDPDALAGAISALADLYTRGIGGGERGQAVELVRQHAPDPYWRWTGDKLREWVMDEYRALRTGSERRPGPQSNMPVGAVEIADLLGVGRSTVDQWRQRGLLPEPRWTVGGRPAWAWSDIATWAAETGRIQ